MIFFYPYDLWLYCGGWVVVVMEVVVVGLILQKKSIFWFRPSTLLFFYIYFFIKSSEHFLLFLISNKNIQLDFGISVNHIYRFIKWAFFFIERGSHLLCLSRPEYQQRLLRRFPKREQFVVHFTMCLSSSLSLFFAKRKKMTNFLPCVSFLGSRASPSAEREARGLLI